MKKLTVLFLITIFITSMVSAQGIREEQETANSANVKSPQEVTPQTRSDRRHDNANPVCAPQARGEKRRELAPQARSERQRELAPQARGERQRELAPQARSERQRELSPQTRNERQREFAPQTRGEKRRELAPQSRNDRQRELAPQARNQQRRGFNPQIMNNRQRMNDALQMAAQLKQREITVSGKLKLERGFVAVQTENENDSNNSVFIVPSLNRFIGFINGFSEDANVSVEGYRFGNMIHLTKLTIGDRTYDFPAGQNSDRRWENQRQGKKPSFENRSQENRRDRQNRNNSIPNRNFRNRQSNNSPQTLLTGNE